MNRKSVSLQLMSVLVLLALMLAAALPRHVVADSGELSHLSRYPDGEVGDEEFLARNPELITVARYEAMAAAESNPLAANPELRFVAAGDRNLLAVNPELKYMTGYNAPVVAQH